MEKSLDKAGIEHIRTKTWTTDTFYRETAAKVKRRLAAGTRVVDMEASAIMAWAQYQLANIYQIFYTADYVDHQNHEWDARREDRKADAMTFFEIALVIARELVQTSLYDKFEIRKEGSLTENIAIKLP